jgi:hypothetical protein
LVELNQSQQFIEPCPHEAKLRREGVGFVGQDFQIARDSARVARVGKTRRVLGEKAVLAVRGIPGSCGMPLGHRRGCERLPESIVGKTALPSARVPLRDALQIGACPP